MQVTTQNEGGGGSAAGMNGGGEGGLTLKKGPWTAAEDAVLAEYVRTHGEGNWNAVQKNTGLARCGKSCRLRWANHLRPNLKKGAFSPEEERIIVELHAKIGNKWARMATQLPGRTDNEIKNYWNTRVKRRHRQGLPLYPPDIQPLYSQSQHQRNHHHSQAATPIPSPPITSTSSFSFQTPPSTTLHSSMLTAPHPLHIPRSASQPLLCNPHSAPPPPSTVHNLSPASPPPPLPSPSPSTPPPLPSPSPTTPTHVSPLQSPHKPAFSTLPLFDNSTSNTCNNNTTATTTPDFFFPRTSPSLQAPLRYKRFRHDGSESNNNNHNIAVNGGGSSSTTSSFMLPFSHPPQYPSYSLDPTTLDLASSSRILRPHYDSGQFIPTPAFVYPLKMELPSNQMLSQGGNSEVALHTKGNYYGSNDQNNNHHHLSMPISGNGLLEDMLEEAQVLAGNNEIMRRQSCLVGFSSCSEGLASAMKAKEETPEQINTTHEDYSRQLNAIPSSMPILDWYNDSGEGSNGQSSVITDDNLGLEMHHIASLLPADIAVDHGRTSSSRSWDNFPGIC